MKGNLIARFAVSLVCLLYGSIGFAQQNIALPMVTFAEVPLYPPLARAANISGVVRVAITTDGRRVLTARAQGGHKFLKDAAEKNATSWQFSTHEPTTFIVTYVYKLVDDLEPHPNNPRVLLRFPTDVEVDAQLAPGTGDVPISHTGDASSHESGHVASPE